SCSRRRPTRRRPPRPSCTSRTKSRFQNETVPPGEWIAQAGCARRRRAYVGTTFKPSGAAWRCRDAARRWRGILKPALRSGRSAAPGELALPVELAQLDEPTDQLVADEDLGHRHATRQLEQLAAERGVVVQVDVGVLKAPGLEERLGPVAVAAPGRGV